MAAAGLALANVTLGLANIGAGIGFSVAERKQVDELNDKSTKLKQTVATVSNLYDHIYYLVAVNLDRVSKALDKLPNDFIEKVQKQIESDTRSGKTAKAIQTLTKYLGYAAAGTSISAGLLDLTIRLRKRLAEKSREPPEPVENPWDGVPLEGEEPPAVVEPETSFAESPRLAKFMNGLNIAGIVFGVAGLAATIGLGIWTLEKLNKAISDVESKQHQLGVYEEAMRKALDPVVTAAGLPSKSYHDLIPMAADWKKISENFDSYEKSLYYGIRGYYMKKPFADIKKMVVKESDEGKPFPTDGYPLAKTLAGDIKYMIKKKKSDKEILAFFATENPNIGLRFVFDEFFISSLRWY